MKKFVLEFPNGLRCTYTTRGKPAAGAEYRPVITWDGGDPTPNELPEYREWIKSVTQSLSNEWQVRLMHVFMLSPTKHEVWAFEPGGQPVPVAST